MKTEQAAESLWGSMWTYMGVLICLWALAVGIWVGIWWVVSWIRRRRHIRRQNELLRRAWELR